ncbi:MAG: insulinase family protein [Acidobacteria bacterium]|nr:insulinase family protein [Acidobacteriota bacterium]
MASTLASGLSPVRHAFDSGATVIIQETSATPAVSINATFLGGSVYDPEGLPGLSYLVSRVIDRGTTRQTADAIAEELDKRGVTLRIGTTRHSMTFCTTCLTEDFDDVLDLVLEVARHPIFFDDELGKRRAEAITALRQNEDNPSVRAGEALSEMLYGAQHPYGRPARGSVESLERVDRAALVSFHAQHITPSVLTLAIVGDVRAPHTFDWMLNNILGQFGLGGRLADNIRERQGMAYYAFSTFNANVGEGPLVIRAGVDPSNVERTIEAIDVEVRDLGRQGPTPIEMDESRGYLIGSIPRLLETNDSIAAFLQDCERSDLGLDYDRRLPELLNAVTIDHVRAAAAEVLDPTRAAIAIAGPK